jgi:16S rRNA A1518/A1519 N6-dimethyltransferase RsmA/KsgA/DIM1 with predicted DNA glycosylase/AP lyase activity
MAADRGGSLNIIANLPYYIVSQVLFSLADNHKAIDIAVVTMQLEVAERIVAKPCTKQYGIPSVVFQLYGAPKINFKIPPSVFYPKPNVDSALLTLDFTKPHAELHRIDGDHLRRILTATFQQRRKMLRQSMKDLLNTEKLVIPDKWATKRPEELTPTDFIQLTIDLFGENLQPPRNSDVDRTMTVDAVSRSDDGSISGDVKEKFVSRPVWRKVCV